MSAELTEKLNMQVRTVLEVYDKARENLGDKIPEVSIPTIVVVGDQSSGKSSVLESISQVNLPKGNRLVTSTPLVLKLRMRLDGDKDYATVRSEEQPKEESKLIEDLGTIEEQIRTISADLTAKHGSRIVDVPIHLTIFREGQLDLTLVDLPGLYYSEKVMTAKIKDMWTRYIQNQNAVILYTMPCTNDLDTGEALALARDVDPTAARTLTIVTKIDMREAHFVDQIKEMSEGLGVVCVRNRTA